MSTPSRPTPWKRILKQEESKLGRALAGGHIPSVAKACVDHPQLQNAIFPLYLDEINKEIQKLCSKLAPSHFRRIPVEELLEFQWDGLIGDLKEKAPTLFQVLSAIVVRNDHRRKKTGRAHYPALCTATAILLKERNREMCGLQYLVSLLLFSSHAEKKVSNIFDVCYVSFNSFHHRFMVD